MLRKDLSQSAIEGVDITSTIASSAATHSTTDANFVVPEARTTDEWMKIEESLKNRVETLEIDLRRRQVK